MKEQDVFKLMAEVGPNAKDALDSWVSLQWTKYITETIMGSILIIALCFFIVWIFKKLAN